MKPRLSLVLLGLGFPALLVSWWLPSPVGSWLLVGLNSMLPPAMVALALPRRPGLVPLRSALVGVAMLLAIALGAILRTQGDSTPVVLGLPASALWLLLGLWVVPLILVSAVYSLSFGRFAPGERDLDRLRPYLSSPSGTSTEPTPQEAKSRRGAR